ncbi:RNA pseudouridylate synthase domain-containing protein [Schistosoma japonicum]|uniref:Pseudouridine synthase n=1 Tax=Schistosoma japonicum TaxID=6182 RepID=A0A4Z2DC53_SCHJA|nr:RNA pseudouridylate synthase domain-containing protein [Schistosoma japonicum]
MSKRERKTAKKVAVKALKIKRGQEKKRLATDFVHYENSSISDYYIDGIFRKVFPYNFIFKAYAKRRWINRKLCDVLQSEFSHMSNDVIAQKCNSGDILVNGARVDPDYVLNDNDLLSQQVHRHEFPVLNLPIEFIHDSHDMLVINKPPSIPIHPCGRYTLNSITHILAKDYGLRPLRFTHRLDRMTSGLLLIAKDYDTSVRLQSQIASKEVTKHYICHVDGCFPTEPIDHCTGFEINNGVVVCSQPVGPISPKMGIHAVLPESAGGKPARTHFLRLNYNSVTNTSLVICRLFTGRTHQIRIHTQYLGYPIVEDPIYNSTDWGELKGKYADYGITLDEVIKRLGNSRDRVKYLIDETSEKLENSLDPCISARLQSSIDPLCPDCKLTFKNPEMNNLVLRLHAYRYSGPDWLYSAPLPSWVIDENVRDLDVRIEEAIKRL